MKKIEVPEEFSVYLENAVEIITSYTAQGKDLVSVTQDIAKFQYYLRARKEQCEDILKYRISKEVEKKIRDTIASIISVQEQVTTVFKALTMVDDVEYTGD